MDMLNEAIEIANNRGLVTELARSRKYSQLDEAMERDVKTILKNCQNDLKQQFMNEGTTATDIAQFTPIYLPMVRRIYPELIAYHLLGVQPMSMPTGYIYALTNQYLGDGD